MKHKTQTNERVSIIGQKELFLILTCFIFHTSLALATNPPVIALGTTTSVDEDGSGYSLPATSFSDADDDGMNTARYLVDISVDNGQLAFGSAGGLSFAIGGSGYDSQKQFDGVRGAINNALANLLYTPAANFSGTANITITIDDNESGGGLTDTEVYSITVNEVNDAPVITYSGSASMDEDQTNGLIPTISVSDPDIGASNLRVTMTANDGVISTGANGGLSFITGDGFNDATIVYTGALASVSTNLTSVVFTPDSDFYGTASITVTIDDNESGGGLTDSEVISIMVNAVNDAPVITLPATTDVDEDSSDNDLSGITISDVESSSLRMNISAESGKIHFTSSGGVVFVEGSYIFEKSKIVSGVTGALQNALSNMIYTPDPDFSGTENITITIDDDANGGGLTDTEVYSFTVNAINDAPVLSAVGNKIIGEQEELNFTVITTDVDLPANTLTYSLDATSSVTGMTIDGSTGEFSWTPSEAQDGDHTVTIFVSDGSLSDEEIITISVSEVNVAPVLAITGSKTVDEETALTFTVSSTDSDLPANTLTYSLDATSLAAGMAIDDLTGVFSWTPSEVQSGLHKVTVVVSDGNLTDEEEITLMVTEVNQAPTLTTIGNKSINVGEELSFTASAADADLPANTLSYSLAAASIDLGMTIEGTSGVFKWTPDAKHTGTHKVVVSVSDGEVSDTEEIDITVNAITSVAGEVANEIVLYPNPVVNDLNIALEAGRANLINVQIIEIGGRIILEQQFTEQQLKINTTSIEPGTYILRMHIGGKAIVKKFVKI
ncbi:tandem-95 repeat protein [Reichenbachiella sp.]|uniref:T9SS type A sorting domain-containing protein n=1 Tax=Reichenbachiella sp. TaxID=2184521 RepID=UPI003BAFFED5